MKRGFLFIPVSSSRRVQSGRLDHYVMVPISLANVIFHSLHQGHEQMGFAVVQVRVQHSVVTLIVCPSSIRQSLNLLFLQLPSQFGFISVWMTWTVSWIEALLHMRSSERLSTAALVSYKQCSQPPLNHQLPLLIVLVIQGWVGSSASVAGQDIQWQ